MDEACPRLGVGDRVAGERVAVRRVVHDDRRVVHPRLPDGAVDVREAVRPLDVVRVGREPVVELDVPATAETAETASNTCVCIYIALFYILSSSVVGSVRETAGAAMAAAAVEEAGRATCDDREGRRRSSTSSVRREAQSVSLTRGDPALHSP